MLEDPCRDRLRHRLGYQQIGKDAAGSHHQHAEAGDDPGVEKALVEIAPRQLSIYRRSGEHGVEHGDGGGFGRRHDAGEDAAQDDDRHQEREDRVFAGQQDLLAGELLTGAVAAHPRTDVDIDHQGDSDEEAGNDAGQEQLPDRRSRGHRVDDHDDARRDDRTKQGGRARQCRGEFPRIAAPLHLRDHDAADRGDLRKRRAGIERQQRVGDDGGMAQTAVHMPNQRIGEVDEALGDAAAVHQFARQDEEGDGHQREGVHPVDHAAGNDDPRRGIADDECAEHRRDADRKYDRHTEEHQQQHASEQDDSQHADLDYESSVCRSRCSEGRGTNMMTRR